MARQHGRMQLLAQLQNACDQWEPARVPGRPTLIDVRWNVGLEGQGLVEPPDDQALLASLSALGSITEMPLGLGRKDEAVVAETIEKQNSARTLRRRNTEFKIKNAQAAAEAAAAAEAEANPARRRSIFDQNAAHGRFCYFCATLASPIRAQHTFVECPKRRKANAREYSEEAMAAALQDLDVRGSSEGRDIPTDRCTPSRGAPCAMRARLVAG